MGAMRLLLRTVLLQTILFLPYYIFISICDFAHVLFNIFEPVEVYM
jgi:hypothetical protein